MAGWRVECRHDIAGVIVADLLRAAETWLIDEGLPLSAEPGMTIASRICWPAGFAMTCGVIVPVDAELVADALCNGGTWLRDVNPEQVADDPRFATAIYRSAIDAASWIASRSKSPLWPAVASKNCQSRADRSARYRRPSSWTILWKG
jgi:hypothetical protein